MPKKPTGIRTAGESLQHALSELCRLRAREEQRLADRLRRLRGRHEQERAQLTRAHEQQVGWWVLVYVCCCF
jgi:hypothetical protein